MYAEHQSQIAEWGNAGPDNFRRVCEFVLATIRVPFPEAVGAMVNGWRPSKVFFGSKLEGLSWLEENVDQDFVDECRYLDWANQEEALMEMFLQIPGLGLAKAGFCCQLLYGRVGCLDTHNLVRFGFSEEAFQYRKKGSLQHRRQALRAYIAACEGLGGSEVLWDSWCVYVAAHQGYGTAEEVSAMHIRGTVG